MGVQELHLERPGCPAKAFWLLLEHLSLISHEKFINSMDFIIFELVSINSELTMDDSLLSLEVTYVSWFHGFMFMFSNFGMVP